MARHPLPVRPRWESPETFLTVRQVGEALNVHQDTVRRWVKTGKLAGIILPSGQVRVRASSLDPFFAPQTPPESPREATA